MRLLGNMLGAAGLVAALAASGVALAGGPGLPSGPLHQRTAVRPQMVGDLALTYVGPVITGINQTTTFTFKPFNNGPGTVPGASGIRFDVMFPSQFEYPITMNGTGWTCSSFTPSAVTVSCTYGGVPVAAQHAMPPIVVTVVPRRLGGGANCATVVFVSAPDANPADNRSCADVAVR